MAQPTFFGDGHTQRRSDAKRVILCKKLGEVQDSLGASALPANNPEFRDTRWILMQKWLCALNGVSYPG